MTITAPPDLTIRGYRAGFTIKTVLPSAPSAPTIASVTAADSLTLLVIPGDVSADTSYVELTWSDTELGTYVYHSSQESSPLASPSFSVIVDAPSTTKWFKVRSVNEWGESSYSAASSGTSSSTGTATPGEVTGLGVAAKTTTTITYEWDALSGVTSYTLDRWNGSNWTTLAVTGITDITYQVTGLTAGTEYGARIRGVNSGAASPNGPVSASVWEFTESSVSAPDAGTIVATADGQTEIDVTQGTAGSGWDTQSIRRSTTLGGVYSEVATSLPHSTTGLSAETTRYYKRIVTNTTSGLTAESPVVSATTAAASSGTEILYEDVTGGAFTTGPDGARITSLASGNVGTPDIVEISSDRAQNGTHSIKCQFGAEPTGEDGKCEIRFDLAQVYPELVVEYDLYVPTNYIHRNDSPNNNKLLRLWPYDYGGYGKVGMSLWRGTDTRSSGRLDWQSLGAVTIGPKGASYANMIDSSDFGTWVRIKVHAKVATAGTFGTLRVWKNDVLVINEVETVNNYNALAGGYRYGYLPGWSNSGFAENTAFYVDRIRIRSGSE